MALGKKRLEDFLARHRKLGLDTSVFVFQVEEHAKYGDLADAVFLWLEGRGAQAVTSTITMLELLVQPYRLSDMDRVDKFYALLSNYPHLEWIPPTLEIADRAARLRAEHNLRTPDALQAAAALAAGATGFVSNDTVFRRVEAFETVILDDLLRPARGRP